MTPTFTPDAKRILANPEYAAWQPQSNDIHVDAIKFTIPEFLVGAFEGQYGLVFVAHASDTQPLQEQLAKVTSDLENSCSILYMPAAAMIRFATANPNGINGYKDPVTHQGYSELDRPYLAEDVQARLVPWDGPHAVTAVTKKGKAALLKNLKAADKSHYEAAKQDAVKRAQDRLARAGVSAERPYRVRLQGTGKLAWAANAPTETDAYKFIELLRERSLRVVGELMILLD